MRKLLVNAQITATISIIEGIINIAYIITVALTVRTSYGTLIYLLILYMLVVPYSFLMNTSHNKERIIEHGWINIVKNILGRFYKAVPSGDPLPTISNDIEMKPPNIDRKPDVGPNRDIFDTSSSNHEKTRT